MEDPSVRDTLEPLVHASQLLQVKKQSDSDAKEVCDMCTSLNAQQVMCIVHVASTISSKIFVYDEFE